MKFRLQRVEFMPKQLEPGIVYFAEKFGAAAHLCACGCGSKIRTPIDVTEWSLVEDTDGPTLFPSIGNWQKPCRSHYLIRNGQVIWCKEWTDEQIEAGRQTEQKRRVDYLDRKYPKSMLQRFWGWIRMLFE